MAQALQMAFAQAGLSEQYACLSAHSINAPSHIMECNLIDIIHLGRLSYAQAYLVFDIAASLITPNVFTLCDLHKYQSLKPPLELGIPDVDKALGGGLNNGSITELVGPAGMVE
jgi:hypothetical protein